MKKLLLLLNVSLAVLLISCNTTNEIVDQQLMEKIPDSLIYQGDIVLSIDQYNLLHKTDSTKLKSSAICKPWPSNIIYYSIEPTFTQAEASEIEAGLASWESGTNINFVWRTNQTTYINFQLTTGTPMSYLGFGTGIRPIYLNRSNSFGNYIIKHEIAHALGLDHEHQKPNRDLFINMHWDQVDLSLLSQYSISFTNRKYTSDFDFNSITLGAADGLATKISNNLSWQHNTTISYGDFSAVNDLMQNPSTPLEYRPSGIQPCTVEMSMQQGLHLDITWQSVPGAIKYLVIGTYKGYQKCLAETSNTFYWLETERIADYSYIYICPVNSQNVTAASSAYTMIRENRNFSISQQDLYYIKINGDTIPSYGTFATYQIDPNVYGYSDLSNTRWELKVPQNLQINSTSSTTAIVSQIDNSLPAYGTLNFYDEDVRSSSNMPFLTIPITYIP